MNTLPREIYHKIYNQEGELIELDDVQRVRLVCFKCTNYINDKFAVLTSPYDQFFSDEVYKNTTVYLCENCYKETMVFCGAEKEIVSA